MFSGIFEQDLPRSALLNRYAESGDYTDCFSTEVSRTVTHAQYVEAFYTTLVFKLERWILKWLVSRPSTDAGARSLAIGEAERFAAWQVEARAHNQLLMCDFRGNTRSWLMSETLGEGTRTRLYFGSAVVKHDGTGSGERRLKPAYAALLGFHRLYSRILLAAAKRKLR